jgi:hypothetical protein
VWRARDTIAFAPRDAALEAWTRWSRVDHRRRTQPKGCDDHPSAAFAHAMVFALRDAPADPRTSRRVARRAACRTLCEREERQFALRPLSKAEAEKLQTKTEAMEEGLKSVGVRREWASSY